MPQELTGVGDLRDWIHLAVVVMEVFAVVIIVTGFVLGAANFLRAFVRREDRESAYGTFRLYMGRTLLLGLEILVAADIVNTVALEPTARSVLVLGLLILIRTFLGWSLVVELEERWPWQQARSHEPSQDPSPPSSLGQQ